MDCGNCRHDNQADARFCSECGAPLSARCPACNAEQAPTAKFCDQCGTSMGGASVNATAAATAAGTAGTAVRKQVTALFADLVGSTAFGEQLDPEAVRSTLAPYFAILRTAIEDHAGTVIKFTGDGVLAIFGVPEVAEDDALRAVASGRALQDRFRAFAEQVRQRHGVELGLRVGINTGELVVGDHDAELVGDVLNTAARLESSCDPGRVLVGEDTWRLTRSSVSYEVLGEVAVKGKSDGLATFQVVEGASAPADDITPFVGRNDELDRLRSVFDDTVARSTTHLVTVIGAPGVGKTRLAAELRSASSARTFDLRFERRGSTTFTPIADLLRELTGAGSADDVKRLVADHPDAARLAPILASLLSHGAARSTEESFWAIRRLFEHLAADTPLIVVVDDIQWAEPLFWDLLEHLVEWAEAPVLLVALARPEIRELRPDLARPGKRVSATIDVEGLDADTTLELAARLLGTDELPAELIDRLSDSTEGNPLFVRELVQMLVDDGVLARTGDDWHLTIDVDAIEVPPTILSLLASRVERLPNDERQVVELASVIGTEFDRGLLGSIAGADVAAQLGALIDRLRRNDLIEPSGTWAGDHPVYRFHHVLVRDAAYRRLLKGHRASLHERVGQYLEELAISGDEADVVIAHHYEQAHHYRSELGTVDEATRLLAGQATRRLRVAAEQALAREDLASAGGYTIRALALAGDSDERDELLVLGCEALLSSGDVARGAPLVEEFLARDLDKRLVAWADCFRAQLWSLTDSDRLSEASELTDDAARRLEALGDSAGVATARLVRALILARLGRVGDCEAELDLALGAARAAGDRRRTVAVLGAAPLAALWGPSPVARAGGRCLDVLRLLRITTTSPAVEATSIRCQGMLEALRGRFDSARDKFETSRTAAHDLGLRHGLYETELFEGFVELLAGNPGAAEPHLVLARDGLGALGIGADAGQAGALLARSVLQQGRVDEADQLAVDALASAGQNLQTAIASRSVLAEIRAVQGRHDEARQYADQAIEIAERTDVILDHALALDAAARVARQAGDLEAAARFARAVQGLFDDKGVTIGTGEPATTPGEPPTAASPPHAPAEQATAPPKNAAWEISEGLWSAWVAGDRHRELDLLTPGFEARVHELGPELVTAFSGDRYATIDVLFESLADERSHLVPNRLVAIRGEHLALIATGFRDGESVSTMYTVLRVGNGRAEQADFFAADQFIEARDQLDRDYLTSLGFGPDHWIARNWALAYERRTEDWTPVLHPEFEYAEHRSLHHRDGGAGLLTEITDALEDGTSIMIPRVFGVCDRAALYERVETPTDGTGHVGVFIVLGFANDSMRSADVFDFDDLDAALARYDELCTADQTSTSSTGLADRSVEPDLAESEMLSNQPPRSGPRPNIAADVLAQFLAAASSGQSAMAPLLHPDFSSEDRAPSIGVGAVERSGTLDGFAMFAEQGLQPSSELIATRGDSLCLARFRLDGDLGNSSFLLVVQVEGRLGRSAVRFGADQYTEAQLELDRLWFDELGFADDHPARHLDASWYATDGDAILATIHPDITWGEHRTLWYSMDGPGEFAAGVRALELIDHVIVPTMHRISEHGVVYERHEVGPAGEVTAHQQVVTFRDGLTVSIDNYDLDDLAAALARFDELTAEAPSDQPRTFSNRAWEVSRAMGTATTDSIVVGQLEDSLLIGMDWYEPDDLDTALARHDELVARSSLAEEWNRAATVATQAISLVARGGFDVHRELFAPEYVHEHGGLQSQSGQSDAESSDQSMTWMSEQGSTDVDVETIAVRGGSLCLQRWLCRFDSGDEIEYLVLAQIDADDRVVVFIWYDSEQIVDAHLELDRRWLDELGLPAHHTAWTKLGEAYETDPERAAATLHPKLEFVNHRRLAYESGGASALTNVLKSTHFEMVVTMPRVHRLSERGAVVERVETAVDEIGENRMIIVVGYEDGLSRHLEGFDVEDLDRALARYDELVAVAGSDELTDAPGPIRHGPELANDAWQIGEALAAAMEAGDRGRLLSLTGERFEAESRHRFSLGVVLDRTEWVDMVLAMRDAAAATTTDRTLLAVRGDSLCLQRVTATFDGDEIDRLSVLRVSDGCAQHMVWFEPDALDDALEELDRQYAASAERGNDDLAMPEVANQASESADAPANSVWQRVLQFRDAWNANDRARLLDVLGDGATFEGRQHGHTGIVFGDEELVDLVLDPELYGDASSREFHLIASRGDDLCLCQIDENVDGIETRSLHLIDGGERGLRLFRYDLDQLAEATAELDRLHARARPGTTTFTNAAWEGHLRFRAAWMARDREACRTILGDEFEVVPMHNLSTGQSFGADELLDLIFDNDDLEIEPEQSVNTLVAIRGDNLCLYRTEETAASGTGARYWLNDTAASRLYRLDETQLIEAQIMLDRLWFDSLGFVDDHPIRTLSPATYAVDPEAVLAIAHPEIAYREHRRLSFEGGGRDQLAARTSSLPLVDHVIVPVIHRISDATALFHKDEINANGDTSSMLVVATLRDGLAGSYDIYESDDLDAASARYDQSVADAEQQRTD